MFGPEGTAQLGRGYKATDTTTQDNNLSPSIDHVSCPRFQLSQPTMAAHFPCCLICRRREIRPRPRIFLSLCSRHMSCSTLPS